MDVLTNLRTFLMVARYDGFSEAARHLNVVPSVAAKRVSQLEKTVGATLFIRTTRSTRLTDAGEMLRTRAAELVSAFDGVVNSLRGDQKGLSGHIRVMAPTTLTTLHLGSVFSSFLAEHPNVKLEVELIDRAINPLEEGYDMVISGRSATYDGVTDFPLRPANPLLCAAPSYLAIRGSPSHPRDLAGHDCLIFRPAGTHWIFHSASEGSIDIDVSNARYVADDNLSLLACAKAGCGVAVLPRYIANPALLEGSLVEALASYPPSQNWFRAFIPKRKLHVPRIKAFLDHLTKNMARLDDAMTPVAPPSPPRRRQHSTRSRRG
jgi:DNA-binding transcriptional LysR family regulator